MPSTANGTEYPNVESLVKEIKENLRLSSSYKATKRTKSRPSPYKTTDRNGNGNVNGNPKDPYDMLQELLKEGDLIKEAVKRLKKGLTPKQKYFYDSDEEMTTNITLQFRDIQV